MPSAWKDRFIGSGHSLVSFTPAETLRYFRAQENLANRKQADNQRQQKEQSRAPRLAKSGSSNKQSTVYKPKHAKKRSASGTFKSSVISDNTACPVHPDTKECNISQGHVLIFAKERGMLS